MLGGAAAPLELALTLSAAAPTWPQFRGPGGSGVAPEGDFPVHFGPDSNLVWKVPLPPGNSSPCIWGDRVFLTAFENRKLHTLCLDRASGQVLWRRELEPGKLESGSGLSSPASSTPTTDGRRVYAYFAPFGLVAYDFAGQEVWRKPLPTPVTQHGASTSPVLAGDLLLLNCDQDRDSYLLAVHRATGQTAWKADREGVRRGFSTPLIWPGDKPELALVAGTLRLVAYDLQTGAERWLVRGLPNEMVASPVAGEGLIFVAGWTHGSGVSRMPEFAALLEQGDRDHDGKLARDEAPNGPARAHFFYIDADKDGFLTREEYDSMAQIFTEAKNICLAIRPGGAGDVTDTHVVWKQTRGLPYVPSPLLYDGRLYLLKNGGLLSCFEARAGRPLYLEERLGALGDYYASPVAAAGKVLVISQQGMAVVVRAADTLEVLARNPLGEQVLATPAIVERHLYVRTKGQLVAFGAPPPNR
jgi:outer membrane protein assembly factor BamB